MNSNQKIKAALSIFIFSVIVSLLLLNRKPSGERSPGHQTTQILPSSPTQEIQLNQPTSPPQQANTNFPVLEPLPPLPSISGSPSSNSMPSQQPQPQSPNSSCMSMTWVQKNPAATAHAKNLISLGVKGSIHPKSICVRVNGNPVPFQWSTSEDHSAAVLIGPEAGPHSKINIRYCMGQNECPEQKSCQVRPQQLKALKPLKSHDAFISALGGGEDADLPNTEMEKEVVGMVKKMDEWVSADEGENEKSKSSSTAAAGSAGEIFKGWVLEDQKGVSCENS